MKKQNKTRCQVGNKAIKIKNKTNKYFERKGRKEKKNLYSKLNKGRSRIFIYIKD